MHELRIVCVRNAIAVLVIGVATADAVAQTGYFNHSDSGRLTRLWIPNGVETVRGILVFGNGAGGDSTSAAQSLIYQRFGDHHNFAVIGTGFWANFSDPNELSIWNNHLAALATASGHPELVHAPLAPIGLSNGGQMSYGFNTLQPEKVIAFIVNKGCCYNNRLPSEAALQTPGLLIAGELDTQFRRDSIRGLFEDNRPRGALWAWVEEENTGHARTDDEIVLPFMSEAIGLRYPSGTLPSATTGVSLLGLDEEDGWLTDQSTWTSGLTHIASYGDYAGNKSTAGWLLNENMAHLYRAFSTYDKPVSMQYPSSAISLGESVSPALPATLNVQVNTSGILDWAKVELFDQAQKIGEATPVGGPTSTAIIPATLSAGGIHALSALVTRADGVTLRTTNIVTVLTASLAGDFNRDSYVNAADYVAWRKTDNSTIGYNEWLSNFGNPIGGSGASSETTVPEPATVLLLLSFATVGAWRRRRGAVQFH